MIEREATRERPLRLFREERAPSRLFRWGYAAFPASRCNVRLVAQCTDAAALEAAHRLLSLPFGDDGAGPVLCSGCDAALDLSDARWQASPPPYHRIYQMCEVQCGACGALLTVPRVTP